MTEKTVTPILGGKKTREAAAEFKDFKGNTHRNAIIDAMSASVTGGHAARLLTAPDKKTEQQQQEQAALGTSTVWPFPTNPDNPEGKKAEKKDEKKQPDPEIVITPDEAQSAVDADLVHILSTPRGHDGKSEKAFNHWVAEKIKAMGHEVTVITEGALYVSVGTSLESTTLFSCHMDTVHSPMTEDKQDLVYDPNLKHIMLAPVKPTVTPVAQQGAKWQYNANQYDRSSRCLGADDGAGVWVMLKMLEAGVKGGYLFHRGEERGCLSSAAIARKEEAFLKQWSAAIAFDRPKDFEVIIQQGGMDCASPEYGEALAKALNAASDGRLEMAMARNGGVTDTRQYRSIIPECINVGVGYFNHHTSNEYLDYGHLIALKDALIKVDWKALPVTRDPKKYTGYNGYHYGGSQGTGSTSYPKNQTGASASSSGVGTAGKAGAEATLPKAKKHNDKEIADLLFDSALSENTIIDWFDADPTMTARAVLQALVEYKALSIKYRLMLSKTLHVEE